MYMIFNQSHDFFLKQFVTVSRDTKAYVWKLEEGTREFELFYTGPSGNDSENAFRIRACRYSSDKLFIYSISSYA